MNALQRRKLKEIRAGRPGRLTTVASGARGRVLVSTPGKLDIAVGLDGFTSTLRGAIRGRQ